MSYLYNPSLMIVMQTLAGRPVAAIMKIMPKATNDDICGGINPATRIFSRVLVLSLVVKRRLRVRRRDTAKLLMPSEAALVSAGVAGVVAVGGGGC
jgi:hypothetical protein